MLWGFWNKVCFDEDGINTHSRRSQRTSLKNGGVFCKVTGHHRLNITIFNAHIQVFKGRMTLERFQHFWNIFFALMR